MDQACAGTANGLGDQDLLVPARLDAAVVECHSFHAYLRQLFDDLSHRQCLEDVPFDGRAAAAALRLYLGD